MKKLWLFLVLFSCFQAFGQTNGRSNGSTFDFPFKPCDKQWESFNSVQDRVNALQIPEETLKNIGTRDLLSVCLNFPYNYDMFLYDTEEAGFNAVRDMFNGYRELLTREDLVDAIMEECGEIPNRIESILSEDEMIKADFSFRCYILFYMIGIDEVAGSMVADKQSECIALIKRCAEMMENYPDIFGISYDMAIKRTSTHISLYKATTRTTPNGYSVSVEEVKETMSNSEKERLKDEIRTFYPNVEILDEPTKAYNCHAYAWHMSDGHPTDYVWMSNPSVYWTTGCYYEVPENEATLVHYLGTHSAIRINSNEYVSKWGRNALIKHAPLDVPLEYGTNLKYYKKYEPKFSCPVSNVISSTGTFSVDFVPENYTITWSLPDDYYAKNCMTVSADGKTCTITRNSNRDMDRAMLSAQISYNGYNAKTFIRYIYAHSGFKGRYMLSSGNWVNMTQPYLIYAPLGSSIIIESGNIVDATVTYEGDITPTYWSYYDDNGQINLGLPQQTQGSAIVIHARCKDGNEYRFTVLKKATYGLSARMEGRQLEISLGEDNIPEVEQKSVTHGETTSCMFDIYNATTNEKKYSGKLLGSISVVDTSSWSAGVYIVRAIVGEDVLSEKIIIK